MKNYKRDKRIDAASKIRGAEKYLNDLKIENKIFAQDLLFTITIRSTQSCAKVDKISYDKFFDWSDIVILSAKDVKNNYVAIIENDMPYLAGEEVNYIGEPILLLASKSKEKLKKAREKILIKYSPRKPILTIGQAKKSALNNKKDLFEHLHISKGDFEKAKEKANLIFEKKFKTGYQEHVYLEPQSVMAVPSGDTIHILGSMQCPYYVQGAMDSLFKDTDVKIDVTQVSTGGAFGGKEDFPSLICGHVALLAQKTGKPVLLTYNREEDIKFSTKRHPSETKIQAAVTKDGKIMGINAEITLDGGAYCTLSPVVLARAVLTLGCYYIPNIEINGFAVRTNKVPCSAFRGFGGPQALFAMEMLIEEIAKRLKITPLQIRQKNMLKLGDTLATGQPINYSFGLPKCLDYVLSKSNFSEKYAEFQKFNQEKSDKEKIAKGIGLSFGMHGCGFTGSGENEMVSIAEMELIEDGKVVIRTANTEMGQGLDTAFKRIVADKLQIPFSDIIIEEKNTAKVPNSGPTVASRSTMIVGKLLVDNCEKIQNSISADQQVSRSAGQRVSESAGQQVSGSAGQRGLKNKQISFSEMAKKYHKKHGNLKVQTQYHHPDFIKFDEENYKGYGYPVYSWSANVAEVEVDLTTFAVQVKKFYTSNDIGKAINHQQSEGQIEGGAVQGIGLALYENMIAPNGEILNHGFSDYIIPTTMDIPQMDVNIVEDSYFNGPFGAKALGELTIVGPPQAVASAICLAIGITVNELPITPEKIYKMMEKNENTI
ncbi:MAG: molybdopterin cofactor-binding domain-containing protein [Candidatus Cloacimonadota bacterium]|nr:molybdopterin cofactor-binding domain-containing protein [Candidatus Cloacimonadota bacterium]